MEIITTWEQVPFVTKSKHPGRCVKKKNIRMKKVKKKSKINKKQLHIINFLSYTKF